MHGAALVTRNEPFRFVLDKGRPQPLFSVNRCSPAPAFEAPTNLMRTTASCLDIYVEQRSWRSRSPREPLSWTKKNCLNLESNLRRSSRAIHYVAQRPCHVHIDAITANERVQYACGAATRRTTLHVGLAYKQNMN